MQFRIRYCKGNFIIRGLQAMMIIFFDKLPHILQSISGL